VSRYTRAHKPKAAVLVRELVIRQDPKGYARNVEALGAAADPGPLPAHVPEFCRELAVGQANPTIRQLAGLVTGCP
jgi:hypothetical protein